MIRFACATAPIVSRVAVQMANSRFDIVEERHRIRERRRAFLRRVDGWHINASKRALGRMRLLRTNRRRTERIVLLDIAVHLWMISTFHPQHSAHNIRQAEDHIEDYRHYLQELLPWMPDSARDPY